MERRGSAVIFDLDGTLTRPHLDFDAIRAEIGLPPGPILESIAELDAPAKARAISILQRHEWGSAEKAVLQDGAVEVVARCRALGHPTAILTRNSRLVVDHFIEVHGFAFDAIRTRDDGAIKPSPAPVESICRQVRADPRRSWMVGDFLFDILSGQAAGAKTVLMIGDGPAPEFAPQADFVIRSLFELLAVLDATPENDRRPSDTPAR
jgi:HAD superfamily hydrolase (TIGR01509 family)